ncbi:dirigent protein 22-like [Chenopodium quinoa]|uniref:dirigent protein 22-like n=1 Tax=Chenopodium quinoa TaxID=63459 RepID=UPI000B77E9EA|nr:dirigent protein 22-like [Chenopodium quinoa]
MACKFSTLIIFSLTFFTITQAHLSEKSFNINLAKNTQKLTKLRFYFHDIPNGNNPTAVIIARPANQTTIGFGTLVMIDDPLTEGPELSSKLVGRAQGLYGESSQGKSGSLLMTITLSFTQGKYNGSSISILGRYRVAEPVREMPIVGGTGVFRLARGYALAKTYRYDVKTGAAISEYNLLVLHYDIPLVE